VALALTPDPRSLKASTWAELLGLADQLIHVKRKFTLWQEDSVSAALILLVNFKKLVNRRLSRQEK